MLIHLVHHYGYLVVFVIVLLDAVCLPLPAETVIIVSSLYAARTGALSLPVLFLVACSAAFLGAWGGYALGGRYGAALLDRFGRRIGYTADRKMLAHYLMERNGTSFLIIGRFFAVARPLENLIAGIVRMNTRHFLAANAAGAVLFTGSYVFGFGLFGHRLLALPGWLGGLLAALLALVLVLAGVAIKRQETRLTEAARRAAASRMSSSGPA